MRQCEEYEIPLWKFLKFVHGYTERVAIKVVCGGVEALKDKVSEFYLTENAFKFSSEGEQRLLEYYKDVPLWNLHINYEFMPIGNEKGRFLTGVLVANCHYRDIRDAYAREKEDIKKAKRKAYREKKKVQDE